jgi:hypothetical protein
MRNVLYHEVQSLLRCTADVSEVRAASIIRAMASIITVYSVVYELSAYNKM